MGSEFSETVGVLPVYCKIVNFLLVETLGESLEFTALQPERTFNMCGSRSGKL